MLYKIQLIIMLWKEPKTFVVQKVMVQLTTVSSWLKKFEVGDCKKPNNHVKSGGSKTVDSKTMPEAIQANLKSIRQA